jgi:murein DD-endopeptidase MepM/ murein hydrolase activator NlpD
MQVGWPGLSRAIALTAAVTSAFWIALGSWLFHSHVAADHHDAGQVARQEGEASTRWSLLSGLDGPRSSTGTVSSSAPRPSARDVGSLRIPVAGVAPDKLVDTFAQARAEGARRHDAIDILAPEGTPVLAAAPGRVEKLFLSDAGGNTIYVRSTNGRMLYYYAHLSAYARDVREGLAVRAGQFLGTVGHTGNATAEAPHLHFAMWVADPRQGWSQQAPAIDPYPYLAGKAAPGQGSAAH